MKQTPLTLCMLCVILCLCNVWQAYLYDGYWEDIGTIKAFYESNLALTDENPNFRCENCLQSPPVVHQSHCTLLIYWQNITSAREPVLWAATVKATYACISVYLCSFYDNDAPIYTMSRFLPPSKVLKAYHLEFLY